MAPPAMSLAIVASNGGRRRAAQSHIYTLLRSPHTFRLFRNSSTAESGKATERERWHSDACAHRAAEVPPKTLWWEPERDASSACDPSSGTKLQGMEEIRHSKLKWWRRMNNAPVQEEPQGATKAEEEWWHPGAGSSLHARKHDKPQQSLASLRKQYAKEVSSLRKRYFAELQEQRMQKAKEDAVRWQKVQEAKEERLKEKKKRSEIRAGEVLEEKRLLQEQLERERAEKFALRQEKESMLEAKRQKERDIIRQESANWIEEKDLELKIIEALVNPVEL